MNTDVREKISGAATAIEITLGVIILIACVVASLGIVFTTDVQQLFVSPDYLQARLSDACLIIIGIELIKMINSYTIDSVIDVMLLAIARQMVVEHTAPIENLVTVIAVGILFVIRKYLYISHLDKRRKKKDIEENVRAAVPGEDIRKKERCTQKSGPPIGRPVFLSPHYSWHTMNRTPVLVFSARQARLCRERILRVIASPRPCPPARERALSPR